MPDLSLSYVASSEVLARARKIKLFLMDVDGTLTDGGVCLISTTSSDGSSAASVSEMKVFNAKDGQGLSLANTMGIQTGFITGRRSPAVARRAEELKVTFVYLGQAKKMQAFEECVEKAGVTDEFVPPVSILDHGRRVRIEDGDSILFFNFRPDRARQLSHALVDTTFDGFARSRVLHDVELVTFTEYERDLRATVAFPREDVVHTLAECVSRAGLHQFHVAETEKYAHVTYFINGGREDAFDGEERLLVPSPRVATYDIVPEMSAAGVTDAVIAHIEAGAAALIIANFANADMVGHTGDFDATVRAVECIDGCIGRIARAVDSAGGGMLVTADHGNAEYKIDRRDGSVLTAHTTSPVPVIVTGVNHARLHDGGGLRDIAPTVLDAMGLPIPEEMTGSSLLGR